MNSFYTSGIALYRFGARLASLRSRKVRHMLAGQNETMARLRKFRKTLAPNGFDVWFHAASLGEFEQARPMIEALLTRNPEERILLSFFSPSGYEVRCNFDPRVAVVYLPFDLPGKVKEFLDIASPRKAIFVKYEFWGNFLEELHNRNTPTYVVSSIFRPGQRFFKPWGGMFRGMLRNFTHLFVQDAASEKLLKGIGINNVTVAGDTRFDRVSTIRQNRKPIPEIELFFASVSPGKRLVFGSSWSADEAVYFPWLKTHSEHKAVIAPHEFDKHRLVDMRRALGGDLAMLYSDFVNIHSKSPEEAKRVASKIRYLIVDSFGLLSSIYAYADIVYVGGGFGAGIHNINEAATYGVPVLFGPNNRKFKEAADLQACQGAFCIKNAAEYALQMNRFTSDNNLLAKAGRAAGDYIERNLGATDKIMAHIFPQTKTKDI